MKKSVVENITNIISRGENAKSRARFLTLAEHDISLEF